MQLAHLTWSAIAKLCKDLPVVVPIAAIEQHGHHLPLATDSLLLGEIVRRADERLAERVVWTPLQWLGNSEHHLDFPGTLTAAPRTYLDLLTELQSNLIQHGFRRIVLLVGHGGNIVPAQQAVFEVRQQQRGRADLLLLAACYWLLGRGPRQVELGLEQDRMGHACEWETSMMLCVAPHLVGDYRTAAPVEFGTAFEPASRGWITKDRSPEGHIGRPHAATAEKGEALLRAFSDDVVRFLEQVIAWDGQSWV
jgi:creatinine amidohydrolase